MSESIEELEQKNNSLERKIDLEAAKIENLDVEQDNLRHELRDLKKEYRELLQILRPTFTIQDPKDINNLANSELQVRFQENLTEFNERANENPKSNESKDKKKQQIQTATQKGLNKDFHSIQMNEVLQRFNTTIESGLSDDLVLKARAKYGNNMLKSKSPNYFFKIMGYLFGGFGALLWIASILAFLAWKPFGDPPDPTNLGLAIILILVALIQAGFNAYQEWSSSRVMKSISKMLPSNAVVRRNGQMKEIPATDVVPGDIVQIGLGNKVPADMRLFKVDLLKIDNSMLTGESEPVLMKTESKEPIYMASRNIAFMGSLVVEGDGYGVVVGTGEQTVVGHIASLSASGAGEQRTQPAIRDIQRFSILIAILAVCTSVIVLLLWGVWLKVDYEGFISLSGILSTCLGIVVAFIPEGLPIAVTMTLTIVAKQMSKQKVLVKSLPTVETLGSVDVICSDKTGTLTQNIMMVVNVWCDGTVLNSMDKFKKLYENEGSVFTSLIEYITLCNRAMFEKIPEEKSAVLKALKEQPLTLPTPVQRKILGDATDSALLRFAQEFLSVDELRSERRKYGEIPFNSRNKWHLTVFRDKERTAQILMKGAAEIILARCTRILTASGEVPLTEEIRKEILKQQETFASNGERVLAIGEAKFATKQYRGTFEDIQVDTENGLPISDLCFIGLISVLDLPRPESLPTVHACIKAGIRVMMVTGDHPLTALSIGKQVGIVRPKAKVCWTKDFTKKRANKEGHAIVVQGSDLKDFDEEMWDWILKHDQVVFARTQPDQKLKIVKELQRLKHCVAVTGDGVNDSPALKQADVGVAMGGGSNVAQQAADLVLLDNNLASLLVGIENGRLVFDNMKKVIVYLLPAGTFSELMPVLFNILFGVPLALSAFLMIFICVITDVGASLSLVFEKAEKNLMLRKPRNVFKDHVVDWKLYPLYAYGFSGILECFTAFFCYFLYMFMYGGFTPGDLFLAFTDWSHGYHGYTQDQLNEFLWTAQTVYFVALIMIQLCNLMSIRTRFVSFFQHMPWMPKSRNRALGISVVWPIAFALLVVYVPFFNDVFNTRHIPTEFWFIPLCGGLLLFCCEEIRKVVVRHFPNSIFAKLAW